VIEVQTVGNFCVPNVGWASRELDHLKESDSSGTGSEPATDEEMALI
jgi:hypothetical protein